LPTYEQIKELANKLEEPIDYFFINLKGLICPIVYFHDGLFVEINATNDDYLKNFKVKETLKFRLNLLQESINNNNYEEFFIRMDSKVRILMFKRLFNKIPDKDLYNIFLKIYSHADYGFQEIAPEHFSRIIKCKTEKQQKEIEQNLGIGLNKDGFLTVYRGMINKSTSADKAYSWTTNIDTATFFATRFSQIGNVCTGNVNIKDVVVYIGNRGEHEILALPGKVKYIKQMDFWSIEKVYNNFPEFIKAYAFEVSDIKKEYFLVPDSIHGILHTKRVLLLSYIIGLYENLNSQDLKVVLTAAKYHDIGRTNDNYDETHGILSFNKMIQLKLVNKDMKDIHILKFIIDNHCISDDQGIENLKNYPITDKNRAIHLYYILKDADGLDRVRLRDTDIEYLRLPISKKLPLAAQQIYQKLK